MSDQPGDCYCVDCLHNIGPNPGPEGRCRGCARRIALEEVLRELVVEYECSNSELELYYELNIRPETIQKAKELLQFPPEIKWTKEDEQEAEVEGWAIFSCIGSDSGLWQVQRFDCPDEWSGSPEPYPFETDPEVWLHIQKETTPLHKRAMAWLKLYCPEEYTRIKEYVCTTDNTK